MAVPTKEETFAQGAPTAGGGTHSARTAVCVEIPVIVNGSRYMSSVRGQAQHAPPFREETHTLIVFPQGAIVRLGTTVVPDETVVLTRQAGGQQVLCRVVSVKAHPGVKAYVELEFKQRAAGFWGVAFPSEGGDAPAIGLPRSSESTEAPQRVVESPPAVISMPVAVQPLAEAAAPPVENEIAVGLEHAVAEAKEHKESDRAFLDSSAPPSPKPPVTLRTFERPPIPIPRAVPAEAPKFSPSFGQTPTAERKSSRAVVVGALAAAALLAAGGLYYFYFLRQPGAMPATETAAVSPVSAPPIVTNPTPTEATLDTNSGAAVPAPPPGLPETPARTPETVNPKLEPVALSSPAPRISSEAAPSKSTSAPPRPKIMTGGTSAPVLKSNAAAVLSEESAPSVDGAVSDADPSVQAGIDALVTSAARKAPTPVPPSSSAGASATIGGRVKPPRLLQSVRPQYPSLAKGRGIQGDVTVEATVDVNGNVSAARAVAGHAALHQAALDAIRQWKYEAATLNEQPVAMQVVVTLKFRLN